VRTVFVNARGGRLSRMGFWKILRGHARRRDRDPGASARAAPFVRHPSGAGGADLRGQELLGHASVATTAIYTISTGAICAKCTGRFIRERKPNDRENPRSVE
jgi:integrase/recombinase XerD